MTVSSFVRIATSQIYEVPSGTAWGWVGYILPQGKTSSAASIAFADTISPIESNEPTANGQFLFAAKRPPGLDGDPAAVAATIYDLLNDLVSSGAFAGRAVCWLAQDGFGSVTGFEVYTRFLYQPFQGNMVQNRLNVALGDNFAFFVTTGAVVGYDETTRSLSFGSRISDVVGFTNTRTLRPGLELNSEIGFFTQVPLLGDFAGAYRFEALFRPDEAGAFLHTGLQYFSGPVSAPDRRFYPLLQPLNAEHRLNGVLDPLDPYNTAIAPSELTSGFLRSTLNFVSYDAIPTALRTTTGLQISLSPRGNDLVDRAGGLAFVPSTPDPAGKAASVQLTPVGDYGLSVEGVAAGTTGQRVLPGLFGSEFLTFATQREPGKGDVLRWVPRQAAFAPVYPFQAASLADPSSGRIAERLASDWTTSWATIVPGDGAPAVCYSAQPAGAPLYAGSGDKPGGLAATETSLLGSLPPLATLPTEDGFAVPFAPYAGYASGGEGADAGLYESQILSPMRKSLISPTTRAALRAHAKSLATAVAAGTSVPIATVSATTPQGLLAEVPDGAHGTYAKVTLAKPPDSLAPDFAFCNLTPNLTDALQTNQLFLVAVNPTNLGEMVSWDRNMEEPAPACAPPGGKSQFLNTIDIADWTFVADIGSGALPTEYRNVMIMKFCDGALTDRLRNPNQWSDPGDFSILKKTPPGSEPLALTGLSGWLRDYVEAGIDKAEGSGEDAELYGNFARMVQDPAWNGVLVLNANLPLTALPAQIAGIGAGIDPTRFIGHHFGATVSRIKHGSDGKLSIDGVSALFGLIDYVDPTYAQSLAAGAPPDAPIELATTDGYGFSVLKLQAQFAQAKLKVFRSRIQLSMDTLFGSAITRTLHNGQPQPIPAVVLSGSAVQQSGETVYVFEESKSYVFVTDTPALNAVSLSRVQFNTLDVSIDEKVRSRFLIWGAFDFATLQSKGSNGGGEGPFDLLSFGSEDGKDADLGRGLAFANLQIGMEYLLDTPSVVTWDFSPDALAFDTDSSTLRPGSLAEAFSLQVAGFLSAPQDRQPADYGFLPVTPVGVVIARLDSPWYGIKYKIDMGSPGALVSSAGFTSSFVTGWAPEATRGPSAPQIFPGLSLPGAAPAASAFSLQGVVKLSTGPISLSYAPGAGTPDENFYALRLENIGVKVLGFLKLPPSATIKFFLFGDPSGSGSLGWWASYIQDDADEALQRIDARLDAAR